MDERNDVNDWRLKWDHRSGDAVERHDLQIRFSPERQFRVRRVYAVNDVRLPTSLFHYKRGEYRISGNEITLTLSKNFWRNQYSYSPASNKERDYNLDSEKYTFRTEKDGNGKMYVCLADAKGETCYRREE